MGRDYTKSTGGQGGGTISGGVGQGGGLGADGSGRPRGGRSGSVRVGAAETVKNFGKKGERFGNMAKLVGYAIDVEVGKVGLVGEGGVGVGVSGENAGVDFKDAARGSVEWVNLKNEKIVKGNYRGIRGSGGSVDPGDPWIIIVT